MTDDDRARRSARRQWGRRPAGTDHADHERGTPEFFADMTRTRYEIQPWHPALLDAFAPTGRLLEIGSGAGTDHAYLAASATTSVAVDLAHEGASLTQARLRMEGRPGSAVVADGESLPFRDGSFDAVYSFGVIHHTDHPERVATEMHRVMRPGAPFLVALYHRTSLVTARQAYSWLRWGVPRRESWPAYLARVESGAADLSERPVVRLYSRSGAAGLFGQFADVRTKVLHLGVHWPRVERLLGRRCVAWAASHLGWYVVVEGRRTA
jgi:SAM-dependent methyltransferase